VLPFWVGGMMPSVLRGLTLRDMAERRQQRAKGDFACVDAATFSRATHEHLHQAAHQN
jgi:hypothetical protein